MARVTIDYGIDLGTTNSSIAILRGTETVVFKNNEGSEITPSAVWLDKKSALHVGQQAKQQLANDSGNVFCEFKLQMGKPQKHPFARDGRIMRPEDLSAEVLKSLRRDVQQRTGEDIQAAVIAVPADFDLPQCDATRKAAELAGLHFTPLLLEPVAAAQAYGFQSERDNVFWLTYDLGGGTFDAAVIQVRDGEIHVVKHQGDNQLGGKLIDWAVVEELLIPAVTNGHRLTNFKHGNPKWAAAIAKLKLAAEEAKIRVSCAESAPITIDLLCQDDDGQPVSFEYDLMRRDVERLAEPVILKSINLCKKVLMEARLGVGNIEKLLLVGGPTLMPYLRERLAERNEGLGIPLEFSEDPLTVVARGGAIFAGTQRSPAEQARMEGVQPLLPKAGQYTVQLEYNPVGADTDPLVGGRVSAADGGSPSGFTIEFVNAEARPPWRSGKLGLVPDGTFVTNAWAEKGRQNTFLIELCDETGTRRVTVPDRFTYTPGISVAAPPLTHSVGVALVNNEMKWFLAKGTPLPARATCPLHTTIELRRGQTGQMIRAPVMEGQNPRADRNRRVGSLEIPANQVKRDVPAGSEVEVTIEIDQSRQVRTKAYVPILDEEYEAVISYQDYRANDPEELQSDIERQKKRLEEAREKTQQTGDLKAQQAARRIDTERMVHDVETSLAASSADPDAADKCRARLLDLMTAIDEVEDALEWPALVAEAEKEIEVVRNIINNHDLRATTEEKAAFAALEREIRSAMGTRDADLLRRKVQEMDRIGVIIMVRQPGWWVLQLENLEKKRHTMTNQSQADSYIAHAQRAINNNDFEGLKSAVRQLWSLLPMDDEDRNKLNSTVRE